MATTKVTKKNNSNFKLIAITSLVWITIAGIAIGFVKYGEFQHAEGMLQGFEKAKVILDQE